MYPIHLCSFYNWQSLKLSFVGFWISENSEENINYHGILNVVSSLVKPALEYFTASLKCFAKC